MSHRTDQSNQQLKLKTLTILISRPASLLTDFLRTAADRNVRVIPFPLNTIVPTVDRFDPTTIADYLHGSSWLFFTSANAVIIFFDFLRKHQIIPPADMSIAAIGKRTAQMLERYSHKADLRPGDEVAEGLLQEFLDRQVPKDRAILVPAAHDVRPILIDGLRRSGYRVHRLDIYSNVATPRKLLPVIQDEQIDYFFFMSSSAVERFGDLFGRPAGKIVSIGRITTGTMHDLGWNNIIELPEPDINRLWEVIDG
jgi:uroporphyrinogen-III synthase